jgi:hypothetical protein
MIIAPPLFFDDDDPTCKGRRKSGRPVASKQRWIKK